MSKSFSNWNLTSCWTIRSVPRNDTNINSTAAAAIAYLLEHEVTVRGGDSSGMEVVAKFVHALSDVRVSRVHLMRGGLVKLTLRRRNNRIKRIGARGISKYEFCLKSLAISSQSRAAIGGTSSPVAAPLALSNSGVVPLVPAPDAVKEDIDAAPALPSPASILPDQSCIDAEGTQSLIELPSDANAAQTSAWLRTCRFNAFESTFASFSAADILRLSRDDLIQICGLADGIRLFNALHSKAPTPKLTLYFSLEGNCSLWRVAYLDNLTSAALTKKLLSTLSLPQDRLHSVLFLGPQGIHVLVTNELVANMKDESMFFVETIKDPTSERYKLLLKPSSR